MEKVLEIAKENFLNKEKYLSEYACKSSDYIRLNEDIEDIRPPYFRDIDRIIHSLSYTRYLDKTQVYTNNSNDHVSKRITHVQLVSKIARTIGRALNLNEDLIEAIALGHDIGHTPLGHLGESYLNEISLRELNEYFAHNIQSVRHLMSVENNGIGLNLCVQVLDGIMCHNGEILSSEYRPMMKDESEFLREFNEAYVDLSKANKNPPMTLEGCVVRISDVIGYIGRDIEDAIMIGKIKREDIPGEIINVLGSTNKEIVNTIILDIIKNSMNNMSEELREYYKIGMNKIFDRYLNDIRSNNTDSIIFKIFLDTQCEEYLRETNDVRKVIDFIAGMTDDLFMKEIEIDF